MADEIAGCWRGAKNFGRGRLLQSAYFLERTIESVQDAIELHAHLKCQRVAGDIVGRNRRTTWITEIVGMILRLEHIENVRPEGLRGFHHPRSGRIVLTCNVEIRGGPLNGDAGLD